VHVEEQLVLPRGRIRRNVLDEQRTHTDLVHTPS
jgi:hypothetical protein